MPSFFVETGVFQVFVQAGLKPISASQVAGITGVSHHAWQLIFLIMTF
jgi:hypothetical protein